MLAAIVQDNAVVEIREFTESGLVEMAKTAQAVLDVGEYDPPVEIGWVFDGTKLVLPAGYIPSRKITKLGLRNRFTLPEKIALEVAAVQSPILRSWLSDFTVSTYIDLSRPDTQAGIAYLEAAGLIAAGRSSQIINATINENEKYRGT